MIHRSFIKNVSLTGGALSVLSSYSSAQSGDTKIKIGFIGVGNRGQERLKNILLRNDIEIPAVCDIDPRAITKSLELFDNVGVKKPDVYSEGEFAFLNLLQRDDIEGVIISTPWQWHTRMAVASMKAGKYTGIEVAAATTIEECWDLVNTYEETGVPLMILENVCYRRDIMAVLQMVRDNLFGELLHFRCGYQHDLRGTKIDRRANFGELARGETRWRTYYSLNHNGDIYPTHGLGPIATYCDLNRGNRIVSLTSTASKARGLHEYVIKRGGNDHPNAKLNFKLGDVVTTTLATSRGETIIITHDCNLPRPYSLGIRVQGTKGITEFDRHTRRIYIEGLSKDHDKWDDFKAYEEKYDHPLWKKYADSATGAGHGGMDFFVANAFIEIVKHKLEAPLDVYDAAAWSSITPLSEMSINEGGESMVVPDFTRGQWMNRKPVFGSNNDY